MFEFQELIRDKLAENIDKSRGRRWRMFGGDVFCGLG
ncbi:hypothetical protein ACP4OV_012376 [Aristida adscensionis]